ncbi:TPA: M42 family peptidase, partial [Candidatus Bathyarchaeota archaeon]|nr:M42 family peptidase [Candidatus Bathyarchaeota archaeon]
IPYQLETGLPGRTDAARISLMRGGIPAGVISIPTRYIHSPTSVLSLKDLEGAVNIAVEFLKAIA